MTIKQTIAVVTAAAAIGVALMLLIPRTVAYNADDIAYSTKKLTHQQEVWISALEWCESRGKPEAINPKDRDNTPSYGSFQFKPSTLDYYAKIYGIATTTVMDSDVQRRVVEAMVLDGKNINWSQQFPDCVLHKVGRPPLN